MLTDPHASTGLTFPSAAIPAYVRSQRSQNLCPQLLQCHCREYWTVPGRALEARTPFDGSHGKLAQSAGIS